jgi:hypothetical protein
MQNEETIWIVTDDTPQITIPENVTRGVIRGGDWDEDAKRDSGTRSVGDAVKVSAQKLEQEMTRFLQVLGKVFSQAENQAKGNTAMQLEEIELSVEISGEGEVKLLGSGAKAGGKSAIKLTFKRKE